MPTPLEPAQTIKLFYSYAPSDEPLRLELEKHLSILRRNGHLFDWHSRKVLPGSEWAEETKQHLHAAQIILLLISADFLASEEQYDIEMQRAIERHSRGEARVIPIILRDVDWKADRFLQKLKVLPANEKPVTSWPLPPTHDNAFADIARGIRRVVEEYQKKPLLPSSPATQGAQVWNVPARRNPFFTGREKLLTALHDQLNRTKTPASTPAQAVSGLGGIGKTQTAVEYAYRYRAKYRAILWVNATTQQTLISDYVKLASLLHLPAQAEQDQHITIAAVKWWLEHHDQWLLILDNADELAMVSDFLPMSETGQVLLTTRDVVAGNIANSVEVEKMGAVHFFAYQAKSA